MNDTAREAIEEAALPVCDAISRAMYGGCEMEYLTPENQRLVQRAAGAAGEALAPYIDRLVADPSPAGYRRGEGGTGMTDDTAPEALARTLRQIENDAAGIVASGPFEALSDTARGMFLDQADRLLASPALDAVVAERVAALAEDEALIARLYRESRGSRSLGDIRTVLCTLAAALAERSQS